jgi:hypothetical protein
MNTKQHIWAAAACVGILTSMPDSDWFRLAGTFVSILALVSVILDRWNGGKEES